jgi:hypothetical protein
MSVAPFPRGTPVATGEFRVNEFTRARDDTCEVAQNIRTSAGPGRYNVTNLTPAQSAAARVEYVNPTILGREGFGYNNASIDADSRLRTDRENPTRQRCPLHLQARPFATVPYMGLGRGAPDIESSLLYPQWGRIERSCGTVTETFFEGQFTPLVPHLAAHVQNPSNLVPEAAASGWIRAGIPSRQYVRDLNC